jgi:hypothetical protein
VQLEGLRKFKKSTSSGTRTGDLTACSIVPQPTTLLRAPITFSYTLQRAPSNWFSVQIMTHLIMYFPPFCSSLSLCVSLMTKYSAKHCPLTSVSTPNHTVSQCSAVRTRIANVRLIKHLVIRKYINLMGSDKFSKCYYNDFTALMGLICLFIILVSALLLERQPCFRCSYNLADSEIVRLIMSYVSH